MAPAEVRRSAQARGRPDANHLLARVFVHGGPWIAVLAMTALAIAVAETALPFVLGRAIDSIAGDASRSALWLAALLIFTLVICDALHDLAAGVATARSTAWLRTAMVDRVLRGGVSGAERFSSGELASRVGANAFDAGRVATDGVRAVANAIPAVGALSALFLIDPWLAVTFVAGVPVLVLFVRTFVRDASDSATRYLDVQGGIAARLADAVGGARTIAAAGTMRQEVDRVLAPLPELHKQGLSMWRAHMRMSAQEALVAPLIEIAVLAVAGVELANGRLTLGEMLAAVQYVALATTLGSATTSVARLVRARAASRRAGEVLEIDTVPSGSSSLRAGNGTLRFRDVTVRAGDRVVLDSINLVIPGGGLAAIVGRSGAGKSLLAALAGQLVRPDEGTIVLDGVPLADLDPAVLRWSVGYGFERPQLIGDTVRDAIAFPDSDRLIDVVAAARHARAHDFIARLPNGYDTEVAAAPISGGELQRIGLARLFAHAGRLIVLDDVAASLDTVTDRQISRVLTEELADRTRIVVAHRASTAARADLVIWLERGRVRAVAPHHALWDQPEYRSLFGYTEPRVLELPPAAPLELDRSLV